MFKNDRPNSFGIIYGKKVFITRIVIFIPVFLLAAFLYGAFTPPRYEVSARIAVNQQKHPADIMNDITTKNLIGGVINKLQLTVSYYRFGAFKKKEIYGDSIPLKFVLLSGIKVPAEITVKILNDQKFEVNQDDTVEDIAFNQPETYSFGRFKVIKGPGFKVNGKPLMVKFNPIASLLTDYSHKLNVKSVKNNAGYLDLSVETTSIAKGTDFLRFLVDALSASESKPVVLITKEANIIKLNLIETQLQMLEAKMAGMKKRPLLLTNDKKETNTPVNNKNAQKILQKQVLQTIKSAVDEPIAQFVQISFSKEVKDTKLETLTNSFNQLEMAKQRALVNASNPDMTIPVINSQLGKLKIDIVQRVDIDLANIENDAFSKKGPSVGITALLDSINNMNLLIKSKQMEYEQYLSQKTANIKLTDSRIGQSSIVSSEKSIIIYPKKEHIFIFAIFIGLILPVIVSYLLFYIRLRFFGKV